MTNKTVGKDLDATTVGNCEDSESEVAGVMLGIQESRQASRAMEWMFEYSRCARGVCPWNT